MHAKSLKGAWTVSAGNRVECSCLSDDGQYVAVGTDNSVLVLHRELGTQLGRIESNSGPVTGVAFGKKGRVIVGTGGFVRLYRIESEAMLEEVNLSHQEEADASNTVSLTLHPDGAILGALCKTGR